MQKIVTYIYKGVRKIFLSIIFLINKFVTWLIFYSNNIKFKKFKTKGIPYISVALGGNCSIDDNFIMNNGNKGNPIGRPQRCTLFVDKGAKLEIGKNVGISSAAIIVHEFIRIGDNVKIGGGVCIYDTDFHSLDPNKRNNIESDFQHKVTRPVIIGNNVFIGAHSTLLKGVTVGENSIIGACSLVTKNIPANQIWAGNPAKFVKEIK
ncbi:MAG: acyltransferase [Draconibacterium sp.]